MGFTLIVDIAGNQCFVVLRYDRGIDLVVHKYSYTGIWKELKEFFEFVKVFFDITWEYYDVVQLQHD